MFYVKILFSYIVLQYVVNVITDDKFRTKLTLEVIKEHANRNIIVSTLSIQFFLCKLASVATGETKKELMKVLDIDEKMIPKYFARFRRFFDNLLRGELMLFNRLIVDFRDNFDKKFLENIKKPSEYGIRVNKVGFSTPKTAVQFINKGISADTLERITELVNEKDINRNTKMLMLTAAHYKPCWKNAFDIKKTKYKSFYHQNGSVIEVPMMTGTLYGPYYNGNHYKFLTAALYFNGISITIVLPSLIKGIHGLLESMSQYPEFVSSMRPSMEIMDVKVTIPRFKIKNYLDITKAVERAGIKEILNNKSLDLDSILTNNKSGSLFVNKIKQNIFMNVDEFGVQRHMPRNSERIEVPTPKPEPTTPTFVVDHPFFFIIDLAESHVQGRTVNTTYHELFSGIYYGPE